MKAVILAGGEGTRLRPLTLLRPKPMIPLFDRPLLDHLVRLLRENGFTDICMTLHYLPEAIREWFGSGDGFGVRIEYRVETEPRGTAGSVRDCADFIGTDDFLVISGDAACSFDLQSFMEMHRLSGTEASILTYECSDPLEYGLVLTDSDGAVRRFLEKPSPGDLCTNLINTGIYALSPKILSAIPSDRAFDFGSELFPTMLQQKHRIQTFQPKGYWNDVGSAEAYLKTCHAVLDGEFPLPIEGEIRRESGYPYWVSPDAVLNSDTVPGPYSVIGSGSYISPGCRIRSSVLFGSFLGNDTQVSGSILDRGVRAESYVRIEDGCVIAEGVKLGSGSVIRSGISVCPDRIIPPGMVITKSDAPLSVLSSFRFSEDGIIEAEYGQELIPSFLLCTGSGHFHGQRVAAACSGGSAAELLSEAFLLGCGSAGRQAFLLDSSVPVSAAFAAFEYDFDLTLFVLQSGNEIRLYFFDRNGLPISRRAQRELEAAAKQYPTSIPASRCRNITVLTGTDEMFFTAGCRDISPNTSLREVSCEGPLKKLLLRCGYRIVRPSDGIPHFSVSPDGFSLSAEDEHGRHWAHDDLLLAYTASFLSCGKKEILLPTSVPVSIQSILSTFKATAVSVDNAPSELLQSQPWTRNACFLCAKLLSLLDTGTGVVQLSELMDALPRIHRRELTLQTKGCELSLLRKLAETEDVEIRNGLHLEKDGGAVHLRRVDGNRIRISVESSRAEVAEELFVSYREKLKDYDSGKSEN